MHLLRVFVIAGVMTILVGPAARAEAADRGHARGNRVAVGRAVPRGAVRSAPRVVVAPRVVRVAPARFYRPYYTFRPRLNLGLGLWLGYPVAYRTYYGYGYYDPYYAYGYPYPAAAYPQYPAYPPGAYPPPAAYPPAPYPPSSTYPQSPYPPSATYPQSPYPPSATYPQSPYPPSQYPQGSVTAQPNQGTGGMSFEITPGDAQVYVDGQYVGTVNEFTPASQPLGLTPGRHHVQISAPGYRPMEFDVNILAGEVLPYQGGLAR
jgi:hypothetical protein